eukprot:7320412-Lingulodinium_polyedra.AAC.1
MLVALADAALKDVAKTALWVLTTLAGGLATSALSTKVGREGVLPFTSSLTGETFVESAELS